MVILKRVAITNENLSIHSYKAKSWAQDGGMKGRPSKILGDREMLHQNQHVQAQRKQMLIGDCHFRIEKMAMSRGSSLSQLQ
jgi:hypothetical protein